jgi:hypothetical protein
MAKALEAEITAVLNQYNETFATYDCDQIAKLYCVPSITMRGDGSIHCFQSRDEIARSKEWPTPTDAKAPQVELCTM